MYGFSAVRLGQVVFCVVCIKHSKNREQIRSDYPAAIKCCCSAFRVFPTWFAGLTDLQYILKHPTSTVKGSEDQGLALFAPGDLQTFAAFSVGEVSTGGETEPLGTSVQESSEF